MLLAAMPVVGVAAPKTATSHPLFKADLYGSPVSGIKTGAVGEAVFLPMGTAAPGVAGAGAGGFSSERLDTMSWMGTSVPGDNTGDSGPGQGFDQGGLGTPYEGIVNTDPNDTGSAAVGTSRGYWGMIDERRQRLDDTAMDTSRNASVGISGYGAGGSRRGEAVSGIVPDSLAYMVSANNISDVSAAYLQMGSPGESGPVVATLFPGPTKTGAFNGLLAQGSITNADLTGPLAGKTLNDLIGMIQSGKVYVNVVTDSYPTGQIGGLVRRIS